MRALLLLALLFAASACTARARGPDVTVEAPRVRITVGEPDQRFCPPGQAKKGNC